MKFAPEKFGLSFRGQPEFTTDGCSGGITWFYRTFLRRDPPWERCCEEHDTHYWRGGSWLDRLKADIGLYECMCHKTTPLRAWIYFIGVRIGGTPWLPTTYRWGYRYDWPRGYSEGAS